MKVSILRAIPRSAQRREPWANGAGSTTVLLREPDADAWTIRVSIANVEAPGPFSDLPDTGRMLVPLDAPMALRFPDGRELAAPRFGTLCFDGSPAPAGLLPEGPTRDFNLMLRGGARGDVLPRTLVDSTMLSPLPGLRWLVYLDSGRARIDAGTGGSLALQPGEATLVTAGGAPERVLVEGAGEIVLVKLYA
ncbi:MAG TPA: HutD family protein [Rhodanobacteraceae bacterium]|nr:HutD family protein [Rhodanobacteraceae bacterium]